jgi:predicted ATP-binding protein involved in virulence
MEVRKFMRINRLEVENLRVFEHAGFDFHKGMNLLAGENGSGKTIILDALRACLSRIFPLITPSRCRPLPVVQEEIRAGSCSLSIKCKYEFQGDEFTCAIRKNRTGCAGPESASQEGEFLSTLLKVSKTTGNKPLGLFYSSTRSLISSASPSKGRIAGGRFNPFAGALSPRNFNFKEFALWMWTLGETASETAMNSWRLAPLKQTAERFLPGCRDLRADTLATPRLVMDMNGQTIDLCDLSGGDLGIMALVLDLARRLMEANPGLPDPVRDGAAVVLIDELELHLHPKRQRTIVSELTENFPNCQFIATTHSPQLISSVKPEQVYLLKGGEVARPHRTLGMDSNWILGSLMGTDERSFEATAAIEEVEMMMKEWDLETARERIAQRRREGFDLPYWSILEARMARMEDLFEREP